MDPPDNPERVAPPGESPLDHYRDEYERRRKREEQNAEGESDEQPVV